jgi:hypothetical protein
LKWPATQDVSIGDQETNTVFLERNIAQSIQHVTCVKCYSDELVKRCPTDI